MKTNHPLGFQHIRVGSYQLYFGSPANRQNLATQTMCSPYTYPELSHTITPSCGICLHLKTPASYNQHPLLISNCPTWFKGHRCTQHHTRDIGHIINKFDLILITLIIKYDTSIKCNRYSRSQQLNAHLLSSKNNRLLQIYPCHSLKLKLKLNGIVEKPC